MAWYELRCLYQKEMKMKLEQMKSALGDDTCKKLDAQAINWANLLALIEKLIALFGGGGLTPTPTPTPVQGSKKGLLPSFNPEQLLKLFNDVVALEPPAMVVYGDLVAMFAGTSGMKTTPPLKCGPDGCKDCCECLDCAISYQSQSLAALVQAKNCMNQPTPQPC